MVYCLQVNRNGVRTPKSVKGGDILLQFKNCAEFYLPHHMFLDGELHQIDDRIFSSVESFLVDKLIDLCGGCSSRIETGYYRMANGVSNKMTNTVVYCYCSNTAFKELRLELSSIVSYLKDNLNQESIAFKIGDTLFIG